MPTTFGPSNALGEEGDASLTGDGVSSRFIRDFELKRQVEATTGDGRPAAPHAPDRGAEGVPPSTADLPLSALGLRQSLARHRTVLIALLGFAALVAIFTFGLRGFDPFNISTFVTEGSYFSLGQSPYTVLPIPPPPNLQLTSLGAYLTYFGTGFDIGGAVIFYKLLNAVLSVLSALIVAKMVGRWTGSDRARTRAFVALLLSPALFFYSFLQVQLDIYGIFWTLVALYVFYFPPRPLAGEFRRIAVSMALLAFAVYVYVFPLALVPVLVIYGRSNRERWTVLATATVGIVLYVAAYVALGIYSPTSPAGVASNASASVFSLPFVIGNLASVRWTDELYALWAVLAIVIPYALWRWGVGVLAAMFASFVAAFLVLPIYNGDEFVWVLPWLTMALVLNAGPRGPPWRTLLLAQCVLLPNVAVFNLYAGRPGLGTGLYYLFYGQFGVPYMVGAHIPGLEFIARLLTGITLAVLVWLAIVVCRASRHVRARDERPPGSSPSPGLVSPGVLPHWHLADRREVVGRARPSGGISAVWVSSVVVLGVFVVAAAVSSVPATYQASSPSFPAGLFTHSSDDYLTNYTTTDDGRTAVLPATETAYPQPLDFRRNSTGEQLSFTLSIHPLPVVATAYNVSILTSSHLTLWLVSSAQSGSQSRPSLWVETSGATPTLVPDWDGMLNLSAQEGQLSITPANHTWVEPNPSQLVDFGRLTYSPVPIEFTITHLTLRSTVPNSVLPSFLVLSGVVPAGLVVLSLPVRGRR